MCYNTRIKKKNYCGYGVMVARRSHKPEIAGLRFLARYQFKKFPLQDGETIGLTARFSYGTFKYLNAGFVSIKQKHQA